MKIARLDDPLGRIIVIILAVPALTLLAMVLFSLDRRPAKVKPPPKPVTFKSAPVAEGFGSIGIERDPGYFAIAEARIAQAQNAMPLLRD